jgi:hypothetical protein
VQRRKAGKEEKQEFKNKVWVFATSALVSRVTY